MLKNILLGFLFILFVFFIIKLAKDRKIIKAEIVNYFGQHFGSFFYIVLLLVFLIFTIYPIINIKKLDLEFSKNFRYTLFIFMAILFLVYGIWIYFKNKSNPSKSDFDIYKPMYYVQFFLIFVCLAGNTYFKYNKLPASYLNITSSVLRIVFWIVGWILLLYFSYYLISLKKTQSTITTQSIFQNTFKWLGIFIVLLFTNKLIFGANQEKDTESESFIQNFLTFDSDSYEESLTNISKIAFFFILSDLLFTIFNWSFIKYIQLLLLCLAFFIIIVVVLFKVIFKITNPNFKKGTDSIFLNTNYIILLILFLISFSILFGINPSHFLNSPMRYLYIIGFVSGLIILFSLSILFNNKSIIEWLDKKDSNNIKNYIIAGVFIAFLYFFIVFVKNVISKFKKPETESKLAFASSTILNIGLMVLICIGLYFIINKVNNSSPVFNMMIIVVLIVIYFTFSNSLFNVFKMHNNTTACPPNMQLWRWREFGTILFLFLGILVLGSIKTKSETDAPDSMNILLVIIFAILGFFIGGSLYNVKEKNKMNEFNATKSTNCNVFLDKTQKLNLLEFLKVLIMITIIGLIFFSMNILVHKLADISSENNNFTYILGLFFMFLFYCFFKFSNTSFFYIIGLFDIIFTKNYFFSNVTHKLNDFLFLISLLFIFFSSMGLIEKVALSNNLQDLKNYIQTMLNVGSKSKNQTLYADVMNKFYYFIVLIFNVIMFIPCIFNDMYQAIYNSTKEKSSLVTYIILAEVALIMAYIIYRKVLVYAVRRETSVLINEPVWLHPVIQVSKNAINANSIIGKQAIGIPENPVYNFGISFWLYIDPGMINNSFLNILNFNNSPAVLYKPSMNTLIFTSNLTPENIDTDYKKMGISTNNTLVNENIKSYTTINNNMEEGVKDRKIVYSTSNINLQTWNNFFINYNDGIMDIFINGSLVNSSEGNMYTEYKNQITIGDVNDVQIKLCNLCFYDTNLKIDSIHHVYNSSKNMTPPVNRIH